MNTVLESRRKTNGAARRAAVKAALPGQVVLVLQGGGALGAYQVGVYQALHEAGIEPDWVIGTSIGAINAALISGNKPEHRLDRLNAFWDGVEQQSPAGGLFDVLGLGNFLTQMNTVTRGIPSFFTPNLAALGGPKVAGVSKRRPITAPRRCAIRCIHSSISTTCASATRA